LPVIKNATRMLVCGEDLGMVPKCVEPIMTDLGILGLRVQRFVACQLSFAINIHVPCRTECPPIRSRSLVSLGSTLT
jgi:4-alpha-glucanotransferase